MNANDWMSRAQMLQDFKTRVYEVPWPEHMKQEFNQLSAKLDDLENLCWAEAEELESDA